MDIHETFIALGNKLLALASSSSSSSRSLLLLQRECCVNYTVMPALVHYNKGDSPMGSFYTNPIDLGPLSTSGSNVDILGPPCKRVCIRDGSFGVEQNKQSSIEILPDECLYEIFRHIPGDKERSSCAGVSKHWLMLLSTVRRSEIFENKSAKSDKVITPPVFQALETVSGELDCDGYLTKLVEGNKATDVRLAAIAVRIGSHGGLGKLLIHGSNSVHGATDRGLTAIACGCPSLRVLSICNSPLVGDEGLCKIARECHSLERLDLCGCSSISDKVLIAIAKNCPNLTSLSIESCSRIGNAGLQAVGKFCTNIHSISIKDCPQVGDCGVSSLMSSASSVLKKVKLQALTITDFSLAAIGLHGRLVTSLVLSSLKHVSKKGFHAMGNAQGLHNLTSLTVSSCRGITDASLVPIAKGCVNLKHACLRQCCFISDNGLVAFAEASRALESLKLEECNRITQLGIIGAILMCELKLKTLSLVKCMGIKETPFEEMAYPSSHSSLRSLTINHCPGFGNSCLAKICKLCPQIQYLDLSNLCGITDDGLLTLFKSCGTGLIKMNLSGCLSLTDKVVLTLTRLYGESLETLNLDGCRKITDASLVSIAGNCLFLHELDVSKCAVTDIGISMLSYAEQLNLQVFSVAGCVELSNKCLPYLIKLGKSLVGLNLQNCSSLSSSGIELLVERLWKCDILY